MDKAKLSRREILAGLAVTGSSGALVGSGTGALFSDEETFSNNSIRASESSAGVVDLKTETGTLTNEMGATFTFELPGSRNNPAIICAKASDCICQNGSDSDCLRADDLRVQLRLSNCDPDKTILTGSLREVLRALQEGVLVACDESDPCLQSNGNETRTLELIVIEDLNGTGSYGFDFNLAFSAQQCRYDALNDLCEFEGSNCLPAGDTGISFIAFCSTDPGNPVGPDKVKIVNSLAPDNGQPTSLVWESTNPVDYVVVFGGQTWTIYDYSDIQFEGSSATGVTKGVATTDNYTAAEKFYDFQSSDSFEHFNGCDGGGAPNSCPCEVASQELKQESFEGSSVKLEWSDTENEFVVD